MKTPEHLRYTEDHEWFDPATGKLGITEFAQGQLGDVIYLDFALAVGEAVAEKDVLGTVESVKTVADIYAPLAGKITALNEAIVDKPEVVNNDPYGDGWMFSIEVADPKILEGLMDAAAYRKLIGVEDA